MTLCPNCLTEYPPEASACPVCKENLSATQTSEENLDQDQTQLVMLAHFQTIAEADLIREILESNGICTVVRGEADPIGGIELPAILVEQRHLDRAREIYDLYFAGESAEVTEESGEQSQDSG
jgi:hypothetical protein